MKGSLYHIQLNISDAKESVPFYKDLLSYFDYKIIDESPEHLGATNGSVDLWIIQTEALFKTNKYHRKNTGLNHLAFKLSSREDVDTFVSEFLEPRSIKPLYNSPKPFPEYSPNYYAVFFEDPDKIKIEVVFS